MPQNEVYYRIEKTGGWLRGVTYRDCVVFEITVPKTRFEEASAFLRALFEDNEWTAEDIRLEKEV